MPSHQIRTSAWTNYAQSTTPTLQSTTRTSTTHYSKSNARQMMNQCFPCQLPAQTAKKHTANGYAASPSHDAQTTPPQNPTSPSATQGRISSTALRCQAIVPTENLLRRTTRAIPLSTSLSNRGHIKRFYLVRISAIPSSKAVLLRWVSRVLKGVGLILLMDTGIRMGLSLVPIWVLCII